MLRVTSLLSKPARPMTTEHFIIELFCRIDNQLPEVSKHPQARLYPSELVTLAVLSVLKGTSGGAFYRWLVCDFGYLFPNLNERTRLFRLFTTHQDWADYFLADSTIPVVCWLGEIILMVTPAKLRKRDRIGG